MHSQLKRAVETANKLGHFFLATADSMGAPHVSIVDDIQLHSRDCIVLRIWPCPHTMANLRNNPKVSVVIWDSIKDVGYQLSGRVEHIENVAVLNGYAPGLESEKHFPQVENRVRIRVHAVLNIQQAPLMDYVT